MRLLTFLKRAMLTIALVAVLLLAGISIYLRVEQHRFRRQAEQLLSDVRELELTKASAAEVRSVVRNWGFEEWGSDQAWRVPRTIASTTCDSCPPPGQTTSRTHSWPERGRAFLSCSACALPPLERGSAYKAERCDQFLSLFGRWDEDAVKSAVRSWLRLAPGEEAAGAVVSGRWPS